MTIISDEGKYEWDTKKNASNIKKHGLSFEQILDVFNDEHFYEMFDEKHSSLFETRYVGIGMVNDVAIVTVCYTERKRTRIISARLATENEEKLYYRKFLAFR